MTTKQNAAQRLLDISKKAEKQLPSDPVKDAWAAIFDLEKGPKKEHEIATNLRLLSGQLDAVIDYAEQSGIPMELYSPVKTRLSQGLSLSHWDGKWDRKINSFGPDTKLSLGWLAYVMPDETNKVTDSLKDEIEKTLEKLNEILSNNDVPPSLKTFVSEQVEIIKKGLRQSDLIGPTALSDALYEGAKCAHKHPEIVEEYDESQELKSLKKVWLVVKKIPGTIVQTNKALGAASGVAEKAQKAIQFFDAFS